jgi:hypothetical protein
MSAQYPISNQNQQVNNQQQEPVHTVGEQQGQDLSKLEPSPAERESYSDPYNGTRVTVHDLGPKSVIDMSKRRPSIFRMPPYIPFFGRTSTESSADEVEAAEAAAPESPKRRRGSSLSARGLFALFRKNSKDNVVLEGVEETEIPRAKHVEDVSCL